MQVKPNNEMDLEDWKKETMAFRGIKAEMMPAPSARQVVKPRFEVHDGTKPSSYYDYDLITNGLVDHLYTQDSEKKFCYMNHLTGVADTKTNKFAIGTPQYKAMEYKELRLVYLGFFQGSQTLR